jgi:hypothetical protein
MQQYVGYQGGADSSLSFEFEFLPRACRQCNRNFKLTTLPDRRLHRLDQLLQGEGLRREGERAPFDL